jgi:hypothetical protein
MISMPTVAQHSFNLFEQAAPLLQSLCAREMTVQHGSGTFAHRGNAGWVGGKANENVRQAVLY